LKEFGSLERHLQGGTRKVKLETEEKPELEHSERKLRSRNLKRGKQGPQSRYTMSQTSQTEGMIVEAKARN
jgi:hypothetical protein